MAASNVEQFMTNWRSRFFRDRIVAQIETARQRNSPDPLSEDTMEKFLAQNSSQNLEEFVFGKATAREHYLELVADLLIHIRQCRGKPQDNRDFGPSSVEEEASELQNGATPNGDHTENGEENGDAEEEPVEEAKTT